MPHLVWDWNGTLLDDLSLVVAATNASLAVYGGAPVTADEHRRGFRRPVADYYARVLGRPIDAVDFARLDATFQAAYQQGLLECALALGAREALSGWRGTHGGHPGRSGRAGAGVSPVGRRVPRAPAGAARRPAAGPAS